MKTIPALFTMIVSTIVASFVVIHELPRWEKEPEQVIACVVCMIILICLFTGIVYFLTQTTIDYVQRSKRRFNKNGPDRLV